MNFDYEIELRKAVARAQDEERERILNTLTQVICQEDNFIKKINEIWMPDFTEANIKEGLGGARIKRIREILEGYLEKDNWEEAKAKGYDPNNLPPCGLCRKVPKVIASSQDIGEVVIDHECERPDFRFTGPGHMWFLTEHKERGKS